MRIFPFSKHEALKPVCVESTVDTSLFINAISHGVLFMSLPLLTRRIGMWSPRKIRDKLALDKPAVSIWEMLFCLFWSDAWESQVSEEADGLWPVHTFATTCLSPFHLSVFKTWSMIMVSCRKIIKLPFSKTSSLMMCWAVDMYYQVLCDTWCILCLASFSVQTRIKS